MSTVVPLAQHLAPDCIARLQRAAERRFAEAQVLQERQKYLAALYLYGYTIEMCLAAAYFRSAGFADTAPIDSETRRRHMAKARQLRTATGDPLMENDPHPLVGWARFLQWRRGKLHRVRQDLLQRLREAVHKAEIAYKHWRPELRYKITDVAPAQIEEVRKSARWFVAHCGRL